DSSMMLAWVLSAFVAAYALAAVFEDEPLIAVPAVAFGLAAVPAWRSAADAAFYVVPMAYSSIGIGLWAGGVALLKFAPRWSRALRASGGVFALVAPAAGVRMLSLHTHHGVYYGAGFEPSAACGATALAVGL